MALCGKDLIGKCQVWRGSSDCANLLRDAGTLKIAFCNWDFKKMLPERLESLAGSAKSGPRSREAQNCTLCSKDSKAKRWVRAGQAGLRESAARDTIMLLYYYIILLHVIILLYYYVMI